MSVYSEIIDEVLALQRETLEKHPITFSDALEIVKIQRMEGISERLRVIAGRIDVLSNVIHENY